MKVLEIALFIGDKYEICKTVSETMNDMPRNRYEKFVAASYYKVCNNLQIADKAIDRIYFGSEFCDKCIPTVKMSLEVYRECIDNRLSFSFVTPPMTDTGFDKCLSIIYELTALKPGFEVIVNDIGLASVLRNNKDVHLVFGRLFDKTSHEGRVNRSVLATYYGDSGIEYAGSSNVFSEPFIDLCHSLNIERVEIDYPLQKFFVPSECECKRTVYLPFSFLTTGRRCSFAMYGSDCYSVGDSCQKICKKYNQLMVKPKNALEKSKEITLIKKGNTVYFDSTNDEIDISVFDRIVLERQL